MRTKAQAYKAALKVKKLLGNNNWQIVIRSPGTPNEHTYSLWFEKGLLTLHPHDDDQFFCLFTFDDDHAGVGDPRFREPETRYDKDPKALVERMLTRVRTALDKEVRELDRINELMSSPKRRWLK